MVALSISNMSIPIPTHLNNISAITELTDGDRDTHIFHS